MTADEQSALAAAESHPSLTGVDILSEIQLSQWHLPALAVAHRLGILQIAASGPHPVEKIAEGAKTDAAATKALLQLLVALRVCIRDGSGYRVSDAVADYVDGRNECDWGPMLRLTWDDRCTTLLLSVRSGSPRAFVGPGGLWHAAERTERLREVFYSAMHARSVPMAQRCAGASNWAAGGHLLDVGCGSGVFSREILREHPGWRATLLDLPEVVRAAADRLRAAGLAERTGVLEGDMFTVPWPDADAVLLADVLHNWNDEAVTELLARSARAVAEGGHVLLHDMLLDESLTEPARGANGVSMVAITGGAQRTFAETTALLGRAGLVVATSYRTSYYYYVLVAKRGQKTPCPIRRNVPV